MGGGGAANAKEIPASLSEDIDRGDVADAITFDDVGDAPINIVVGAAATATASVTIQQQRKRKPRQTTNNVVSTRVQTRRTTRAAVESKQISVEEQRCDPKLYQNWL